jgi:hypothetical protein
MATIMKYIEYAINQNGLEKKLGLLGESHLYLPSESKFARKIVKNFDTVAYEGSDKKMISLSVISALAVPGLLAYAAATGRWPKNCAIDIAKKYGMKIVRIEDNVDDSFTYKEKMTLALAYIISALKSPFTYGYYKLCGNPDVPGTRAYKAKKSDERKGFGYSALVRNLPERDENMAKNIVEVLEKYKGNILVVCGELHLEGVIKNLNSVLDMKEVRTDSPKYKTNP